MPSETNVQTLSQPAKIKDTLAAQQKDYDYDCTPCRLMGMQKQPLLQKSGF